MYMQVRVFFVCMCECVCVCVCVCDVSYYSYDIISITGPYILK